jgi:hypothetical protein
MDAGALSIGCLSFTAASASSSCWGNFSLSRNCGTGLVSKSELTSDAASTSKDRVRCEIDEKIYVRLRNLARLLASSGSDEVKYSRQVSF